MTVDSGEAWGCMGMVAPASEALALLNPQEGIAVGFACNILPRSLDDLVKSQLEFLKTGKVTDVYPFMVPTSNKSTQRVEDKNGTIKWVFNGSFEKVNATTIRVTNLPYGLTHSKYENKLEHLLENGDVQEVVDDSVDQYNIIIRFKKGVLRGKTDSDIIKMLSLSTSVSENLNLIDFDGERVWNTSYTEFVAKYTEWRLGWYLIRYQRLHSLLEIDLQKYRDIINAIKNNVGGRAAKFKSRQDMKEFLVSIGIVNVDYIADLSVYRFTEDERLKVEKKLADGEMLLSHYQQLIDSPADRKAVYVTELKQIKQQETTT